MLPLPFANGIAIAEYTKLVHELYRVAFTFRYVFDITLFRQLSLALPKSQRIHCIGGTNCIHCVVYMATIGHVCGMGSEFWRWADRTIWSGSN